MEIDIKECLAEIANKKIKGSGSPGQGKKKNKGSIEGKEFLAENNGEVCTKLLIYLCFFTINK